MDRGTGSLQSLLGQLRIVGAWGDFNITRWVHEKSKSGELEVPKFSKRENTFVKDFLTIV